MKAIDILAESKINEAPVGALSQIGRKVGAAALSALGAKNTAAGIRGKAQMGDRANQYYTAYRQWLGQTGKDEKTATYADVAQFMKKSGLPVDGIKGQKGLVDPNILNQTFAKISQDYFAGKEKLGKLTKSTASKTAGTTGTATMPAGVQPNVSPTAGQTNSQPFSVPALLQVIPQMSKRDLNRIVKAAQTALQSTQQTTQTPVVAPATQAQSAPSTKPKAALLKPKTAVSV